MTELRDECGSDMLEPASWQRPEEAQCTFAGVTDGGLSDMGRGNVCVTGSYEGLFYIDNDDLRV